MSSVPELENSVDLGVRILVIDDSPENRYVVHRALSRAGMQVIEAATGAEGSRLAVQDPDLIILDVNLADATGFELCRQLKADPITAHVPVILVSQSQVDPDSQVRGLEGGADAYITDSARGPVLVATVRALLRLRRAEDLLRQQATEADRLAHLNSELASAQTEADAVEALLEILSVGYRVRRAHLFGPRPWLRTRTLVYPLDSPAPEDPLPVDSPQVDQEVDEILDGHYGNGLFYESDGKRDWLLLPLVAYGEEMGTLLIEFADGVSLPVRNQNRLAAAAERVAQTMERARLFEQQRRIAVELQSSLLPARLPEVPGVELAADYRAGAEQMVVGGDFYDVFPGAEGWTAIIGDVCGRSAAAAARTSLARHTAREAARHDNAPAAVLGALSDAIDADKRDQLDMVSAVSLALSLRPDGVLVRCAMAGHPRPILISADGQAEEVGRPGPILGVMPDVHFDTVEWLLTPGETLFLYTDGVTEARRSGVMLGEEGLVTLLAQLVVSGASAQELASEPIRVAASYNERHDDDMATLVIRARPRQIVEGDG